MAQILSQSTAMLSNVGHLSINACKCNQPSGGKDYMDDAEWSELLRPFTAVETLHLFGKLAGYDARGLEHVTEEMGAEMLPILYSLFPEDEPSTSVERLVAVRSQATP